MKRKKTLSVATSMKSRKFVFVAGFVIGASIEICLHLYHQSVASNIYSTQPVVVNDFLYERWLYRLGMESFSVDPDIRRYNSTFKDETSILDPATESSFLYDRVAVACLVFPTNPSNAQTIRSTWGRHCNRIFFFSHKISNETIPVVTIEGVKSSFHLLCESFRRVRDAFPEVQWLLVTTESTFALVENLRYYVAPMNHSRPHYLGHAMRFWGEVYNWENAGYVLSRGALDKLLGKFPDVGRCKEGGRYWKNGDWYLGKHLAALDIRPTDTRDHLGRGRFNGFSYRRLLFVGAVSLFDRYWKDSLYLSKDGPKCCSNFAITFHGVLSNSKMFQLEYMFNHLRPFPAGGEHGNAPSKTSGSPVGNGFMSWDERLKDDAFERFMDSWKDVSEPPHIFQPDE